MSHRTIIILLGLFIVIVVVGVELNLEKTGTPLPTDSPSPIVLVKPTNPTISINRLGTSTAESAASKRLPQLTTNTAKKIAGFLHSGSSTVEFESNMESPLQVLVQVRVNGLVLDASADLKENVRILDGHGNALSAEQRETLVALSEALEHRLNPHQQILPPHEDFLVRVVLYWSEAPVGLPLTRIEVRPRPRP